MKKISCAVLGLIGTLSLSASAVQFYPIVNQLEANQKSLVVSLNNTKGDDAVVSTSIMKWDTNDVDGVPVTSTVPLTDEESKLFTLFPPVRNIEGKKTFTTRIIYLGERSDVQGSYRILFKVEPRIKSEEEEITNVERDVYITPVFNLPLLIDPLVKNEQIDIKKVGENIVVKNSGNVAFKSYYKIDGVAVVDGKGSEIPTPVLLPNKTWTVKAKSIELGKNLYK